MTIKRQLILVTNDAGLAAHWQQAFGQRNARIASGLADLSKRKRDQPATLWVDDSIAPHPNWRSAEWQELLTLEHVRVIAASSNPRDESAMEALDAGCAGYCHAYADVATLKQVLQVVNSGNVWIGKSLMQRLVQSATKAAPKVSDSSFEWAQELTQREKEVALLAANGASNSAIATDCNISERTVKAHLSSVFVKLTITDRLQLALRVHGIA